MAKKPDPVVVDNPVDPTDVIAEPDPVVVDNPAKDYTFAKVCSACGDQKRTDMQGRVFCPAFDPQCPRYLEAN